MIDFFGKYSSSIIVAYLVTISLIIVFVVITLLHSRKSKKSLSNLESSFNAVSSNDT